MSAFEWIIRIVPIVAFFAVSFLAFAICLIIFIIDLVKGIIELIRHSGKRK